MKLLIITQRIDKKDPVLGFFHRWTEEFSRHIDQTTVICLGRGEYDLPGIKVLSLGKEGGSSRIKYVWRFYKYLWQERKNYDAVFVHMNQEYVWLGGIIWRFLGKKIWMWRNHLVGNFATRLSVWLSDRTMCTSLQSFIAQYSQTEIMPVGIDLNHFFRRQEIERSDNTILFLSRMAPIKKPDLLIEAVAKLPKELSFKLLLVGEPIERDLAFFEKIKKMVIDLSISEKVVFLPAVSNDQTVDFYNQNTVFINLTPDGSFDKTILEAMACEQLVLISNRSLANDLPADLMFESDNASDLSEKIKNILSWDREKREVVGQSLRQVVADKHSLKSLATKIFSVDVSMSGSKLKIISPVFLRYVLSGILVVAVNLSTLYLLTEKFGVWYLYSSIVSFFVAFVVSFFLQKIWTYRDRLWAVWNWQLVGYFLISLVNLLCNTVILYLLVNIGHLPYLLAQALTVGGISLVLFFAYGRIIFRPKI